MGARLVLQQSPHAAPKEFRRFPAPKFHAASREDLLLLLEARRNKVAAYRAAAERLKRGERDVEFPEDCLPPGLPFVKPKTPKPT